MFPQTANRKSKVKWRNAVLFLILRKKEQHFSHGLFNDVQLEKLS